MDHKEVLCTYLARHARYAMLGAAWVGALAATACKPKTNTADTGASSARYQRHRSNRNGRRHQQIVPRQEHAQRREIVALLDEANKGDSAAGAFALGKTTNPDVKSFAKMMMESITPCGCRDSLWPRSSASPLKLRPMTRSRPPVKAR